MRSFFQWLFMWRSQARVSYQMSSLEKKLKTLELQKSQWDATLERRRKTLERATEAYELAISDAKQEIHNAVLFNAKLEEALEATKEQLLTATDITIPGLVAAHDVLLKRWRRDSAILTLQTVASSKDTGE